MGIVSKVIILSRTKMSGDKICVGGYCSFHKRYVRLLSNTAQALHANEPYQIGEVYELEYSPRYANQMDPPHVEDIAVYEKKYLKTINQDDLKKIDAEIAADRRDKEYREFQFKKLDDAARRFINLVDEFYDRCVKLIVSADAPIESLYQGKKLAFEFQRTVSRLEEMRSDAYLAEGHGAGDGVAAS